MLSKVILRTFQHINVTQKMRMRILPRQGHHLPLFPVPGQLHAVLTYSGQHALQRPFHPEADPCLRLSTQPTRKAADPSEVALG